MSEGTRRRESKGGRMRECDERRKTERAACTPYLTGGRGKGYTLCPQG
jgi:hypothetical protein